MTHLVQLIDAGIGRSLRLAVGNALDEWLMDGVNLMKQEAKMSAGQRRILITKLVGQAMQSIMSTFQWLKQLTPHNQPTIILPLTVSYSTTDTSPPTPHRALNNCESLCSLSLCGPRDVKEEECHMSLTIYGYYSQNRYCNQFCTTEEMKPYNQCQRWTVFDVQEEHAKGSRRRSFWQINVAS